MSQAPKIGENEKGERENPSLLSLVLGTFTINPLF